MCVHGESNHAPGFLTAEEAKGIFHFQDLDRPDVFNGSTVLLATVTGEEALRIENQDDSKTMDEVMQVLRDMYGDGIPNATGTRSQRNP